LKITKEELKDMLKEHLTLDLYYTKDVYKGEHIETLEAKLIFDDEEICETLLKSVRRNQTCQNI